MRKMHWSEPYLNFITIEITYEDNARQTWDYDCYQYESLEALKLNMTADFAEPRLDRAITIVNFTSPLGDFTSDISGTELIGSDFTDLVFESIEGELNGN